jgi:hypothetical protein
MKVGDKVICINTNWSVPVAMYPEVTFPKLYQELTIRDVYYYPLKGVVGLIFEEIKNPLKNIPVVTSIMGKNIEHDFDSKRFAKMETRKKTNSVTKKLAEEALKITREYCPEELQKEVV